MSLLATLVASGPHDHRRGLPTVEAEFGTCDEAAPHWAGHDAAHADDDRDACPLCQLRPSPALAPPPARFEPDRAATPLASAAPPRRAKFTHLPGRSRAPPPRV